MAGALTFNLNPTFGTDFSLNNLAAKRFKLVVGEFTYDAASSSAMTVTTAMVGLNDIRGFIATPKGNVFWQFNPANDTLQPVTGVYASISGVGASSSTSLTMDATLASLVPTSSFSVASITSVPFLCWGFE